MWVGMVIGHNILTSLSASGPAHSTHVGVLGSDGERVSWNGAYVHVSVTSLLA